MYESLFYAILFRAVHIFQFSLNLWEESTVWKFVELQKGYQLRCFVFRKSSMFPGSMELKLIKKGLGTALFEREFIDRISVGEMGLAGYRICMNNSSFASTCHLVNFDQEVFVIYPLG